MMKKRIMQMLGRGMSCAEVTEVLQAYLDGEVDVETARAVAEHLEECRACDRESELLTNIKNTLASNQRPVDPQIKDALLRFSEQLMTEGSS